MYKWQRIKKKIATLPIGQAATARFLKFCYEARKERRRSMCGDIALYILCGVCLFSSKVPYTQSKRAELWHESNKEKYLALANGILYPAQSCIAVQNWIEVLNSIQFFPWTWSIQVQFIGQKLNLNCCSTHHWTFLNWVQSQFRESGVPPCRKEEELGFFLVMTHKIL